jgi:hypothetical protein
MEQEERALRMHTLGADEHLNVIESTILTLVPTNYLMSQTIDISRLQEECRRNGYSSQEFSHGFVRLLIRRLLEPCGEFTYALSAEGDAVRARLVERKVHLMDADKPDTMTFGNMVEDGK